MSLARMAAVKNVEHDKADTTKLQIPVRIKTKDETRSNAAIRKSKLVNAVPTEKSRATNQNADVISQQRPKSSNNALTKSSKSSVDRNDGQVLQNLLMISEGKDILATHIDPQQSCNLYCISRVFWSKEIGRTKICWNTNHPCFQFQEVRKLSSLLLFLFLFLSFNLSRTLSDKEIAFICVILISESGF